MTAFDEQAAELLERSYRTPEIVRQRERTLATLGLTPGAAVLDAGCGTGLLLERAERAVGQRGRAEGVDPSEAMLAHARRRCAALEQVRLREGSAEGSFSEGLPRDFAESAVASGAIGAAEAKAWLEGVDRLSARGEYFFSVNRFLFGAVR